MRRLTVLTENEMKTVLGRVAKRISGPGGVFQKHFERGQSKWPEPGDKYARLKKKRGKRKFVLTGRAKRAMTNPSSRDRHTFIGVTRDHNNGLLKIGLQRMENGRNIYDIVQKGRFGGGTSRGILGFRKKHTASEVIERNRRTSKAVKADKLKTGGRNKRKIVEKMQLKDFKRTSGTAMPLVEQQPGDEVIVGPQIIKCVEDMLRKRGLL